MAGYLIVFAALGVMLALFFKLPTRPTPHDRRTSLYFYTEG